jgi:hypothetical protein
VCSSEAIPAIKWFSSSDMTDPILGYTCVRVDKTVTGTDWKTWAAWLKLARYLGL